MPDENLYITGTSKFHTQNTSKQNNAKSHSQFFDFFRYCSLNRQETQCKFEGLKPSEISRKREKQSLDKISLYCTFTALYVPSKSENFKHGLTQWVGQGGSSAWNKQGKEGNYCSSWQNLVILFLYRLMCLQKARILTWFDSVGGSGR